jgi:hypothetical protein
MRPDPFGRLLRDLYLRERSRVPGRTALLGRPLRMRLAVLHWVLRGDDVRGCGHQRSVRRGRGGVRGVSGRRRVRQRSLRRL